MNFRRRQEPDARMTGKVGAGLGAHLPEVAPRPGQVRKQPLPDTQVACEFQRTRSGLATQAGRIQEFTPVRHEYPNRFPAPGRRNIQSFTGRGTGQEHLVHRDALGGMGSKRVTVGHLSCQQRGFIRQDRLTGGVDGGDRHRGAIGQSADFAGGGEDVANDAQTQAVARRHRN
jgi:hypothetical protein